MDTRTKIISAERAVEVASDGRHVVVVTGHFDVLQAGLVQAFRGISKGPSMVLAVVLNPPAPLLSARARAELAAGLEVVDYVVPVADDATELLRAIKPIQVISEELADQRRAAELIQHVQQKYKS